MDQLTHTEPDLSSISAESDQELLRYCGVSRINDCVELLKVKAHSVLSWLHYHFKVCFDFHSFGHEPGVNVFTSFIEYCVYHNHMVYDEQT